MAGRPSAETLQRQVDDGRREQRRQLADDQSPAGGVSEGLPYLRSGASSYRQRDSAEKRRHRRHQDRAEAQNSRFPDGRLGLEPFFPSQLDRKVDEHDAILLDDADQKNDAD